MIIVLISKIIYIVFVLMGPEIHSKTFYKSDSLSGVTITFVNWRCRCGFSHICSQRVLLFRTLCCVTLFMNDFKCKLRLNYFITENNPAIRVKKPVEGKENKVNTRSAVPNRRSVKRFRSPGLEDTASPGEYSSC
jgi:hypothetical protein